MAACLAAIVAFGAGCSDDGDDGAGAQAATSSSATTSTTAPLDGEDFPGIWPYTTSAEADGYTGGLVDATYLDPVRTAREFMRVYIGLADPQAGEFRPGEAQQGTVEIRPRRGSPFVTTVTLRRVAGQGSPWIVTEALAADIQMISPVSRDRITSPVLVTGRSRAFEGTVVVQVKEDGMLPGTHLAQEPMIGGSGEQLEQFSGQVTFPAPTKPAGAIVVTTDSAEDGSIQQASAVRVRFQRTTT